MRLLICAGGTGGGVYPALAILNALENEDGPGTAEILHHSEEKLSVLWVGSIGGMEEDLVKRAGLAYEAIPAAGVHGVNLQALPGNLLRLARGYRSSVKILRRFQPDVLLFTGGYVAVPMALAGNHLPSVVYVPDIEPGLALKVLARFADRIAVTTEASRKFFKNQSRVVATGYPIRKGLNAWQKDEALRVFGLSRDLPVLLVTGGSSGARSINRALLAALPELLPEIQIIHVTGRLDWEEVEAGRAQLAGKPEEGALVADRYKAFPYLYDEMGAALSAADLVVARAGASALGEYPFFGLPAVLVPYPYAWRYQKVNAEFLVEQGAAIILSDQYLPDQLVTRVRGLIADPTRREQMREAMSSLARPHAARSIADLLSEIAGRKGLKGIRP